MRSRVVALEVPEVGWGVGEAQEVAGLKEDVPLELLPGVGGAPPVAGDGEGAVESGDPAAVGTGEEGERLGVTAARGIEGDGDLEGWAEAGEGWAAGVVVSLRRQGYGGQGSGGLCRLATVGGRLGL